MTRTAVFAFLCFFSSLSFAYASIPPEEDAILAMVEAFTREHEGFTLRVVHPPVKRVQKRRQTTRAKRPVPTIGYGRNLEVHPSILAKIRSGRLRVTKQLVEEWLREDLTAAYAAVTRTLGVKPWFNNLAPHQKAVLVCFFYNVGTTSALGFYEMIEALSKGHYARAGEEMMDSDWYEQLPRKAIIDILVRGIKTEGHFDMQEEIELALHEERLNHSPSWYREQYKARKARLEQKQRQKPILLAAVTPQISKRPEPLLERIITGR